MTRDARIDIIKGFAISFVIIIHTLSIESLESMYYVFHIGQAVPFFMLISGYVFTLSFNRKGVTNLKEGYNLGHLLKIIKRLYVPFLLIYSLVIIVLKILSSTPEKINAYFIFENLIRGGIGPGSYYPIIMFQFLLIFPLIYVITKKKANYALLTLFATGILFEILVYYSGMEEEIYRLIIGRYIFNIALGSYLAFLAINQKAINKKMLYAGAILSATYMYASVYENYYIFGHDYWSSYQAPAYMYTALLFVVAMNYLPAKSGIFSATIGELGKASWHIFLIQMAYFHYVGLTGGQISFIVINLILCFIMGYLFYLFDNIISNKETRKTYLQKLSIG